MSDKGFWIKTTKGVQMPNEPVIVEGYFSKKGNFMNGKRYFKLFSNSIYYFDVRDIWRVRVRKIDTHTHICYGWLIIRIRNQKTQKDILT